MNPTTGSACCCAHTAHGQQVTAVPSATTKKSRRLMGPSPTPRKTIYHIVDRVRRGFVASQQTGAANVRFGSWSCKNPHGLEYQPFIGAAHPSPVGFGYALIAIISG